MTETTHQSTTHRSLWDKIWKDSHGNVVIFQMPNVWLIAWAALTIITFFLNKGTAQDAISWVAEIALAIWAILELVKGVNYFRRALGLLVLIATIAGIIKMIN